MFVTNTWHQTIQNVHEFPRNMKVLKFFDVSVRLWCILKCFWSKTLQLSPQKTYCITRSLFLNILETLVNLIYPTTWNYKCLFQYKTTGHQVQVLMNVNTILTFGVAGNFYKTVENRQKFIFFVCGKLQKPFAWKVRSICIDFQCSSWKRKCLTNKRENIYGFK